MAVRGVEKAGNVAYHIVLTPFARRELRAIRVFERRRIIEIIEAQLMNLPENPTRLRKLLKDVEATFEFVPPLWELRIENYRVVYDVNAGEECVFVRSVRPKAADQTTEDVTHA